MAVEQKSLTGQLDLFTLIALGIDVNAIKNPIILSGRYSVELTTDLSEEECRKGIAALGLKRLMKIGGDRLRITSWDEIGPISDEDEEDPLWLD